jgi:hypothetical protein
MKSDAQRKLPFQAARPAYRTLDGWALSLLMEHGAVAECDAHGHRRNRSDPDAWNRAREEARLAPFAGTTPDVSVAAIDEVMNSIGETCPDCD